MFTENLSICVLRLCDENHLTFDTASALCGLDTRQFEKIARKQEVPSVLTLEKLCVGLNATPNELLLMQKESYRHPLPVTQIRCFKCANGLIGYPVCPNCGITLEREYQSFCDRCGQCLDWRNLRNATVILPRT